MPGLGIRENRHFSGRVCVYSGMTSGGEKTDRFLNWRDGIICRGMGLVVLGWDWGEKQTTLNGRFWRNWKVIIVRRGMILRMKGLGGRIVAGWDCSSWDGIEDKHRYIEQTICRVWRTLEG